MSRKTLYGLTATEADRMLHEQDNKCANCKKEFNENRKPHVDHDHNTGIIRAFLCSNCNFLLGHAQESVEVLQSAIEYLKRTAKPKENMWSTQLK